MDIQRFPLNENDEIQIQIQNNVQLGIDFLKEFLLKFHIQNQLHFTLSGLNDQEFQELLKLLKQQKELYQDTIQYELSQKYQKKLSESINIEKTYEQQNNFIEINIIEENQIHALKELNFIEYSKQELQGYDSRILIDLKEILNKEYKYQILLQGRIPMEKMQKMEEKVREKLVKIHSIPIMSQKVNKKYMNNLLENYYKNNTIRQIPVKEDKKVVFFTEILQKEQLEHFVQLLQKGKRIYYEVKKELRKRYEIKLPNGHGDIRVEEKFQEETEKNERKIDEIFKYFVLHYCSRLEQFLPNQEKSENIFLYYKSHSCQICLSGQEKEIQICQKNIENQLKDIGFIQEKIQVQEENQYLIEQEIEAKINTINDQKRFRILSSFSFSGNHLQANFTSIMEEETKKYIQNVISDINEICSFSKQVIADSSLAEMVQQNADKISDMANNLKCTIKINKKRDTLEIVSNKFQNVKSLKEKLEKELELVQQYQEKCSQMEFNKEVLENQYNCTHYFHFQKKVTFQIAAQHFIEEIIDKSEQLKIKLENFEEQQWWERDIDQQSIKFKGAKEKSLEFKNYLIKLEQQIKEKMLYKDININIEQMKSIEDKYYEEFTDFKEQNCVNIVQYQTKQDSYQQIEYFKNFGTYSLFEQNGTKKIQIEICLGNVDITKLNNSILLSNIVKDDGNIIDKYGENLALQYKNKNLEKFREKIAQKSQENNNNINNNKYQLKDFYLYSELKSSNQVKNCLYFIVNAYKNPENKQIDIYTHLKRLKELLKEMLSENKFQEYNIVLPHIGQRNQKGQQSYQQQSSLILRKGGIKEMENPENSIELLYRDLILDLLVRIWKKKEKSFKPQKIRLYGNSIQQCQNLVYTFEYLIKIVQYLQIQPIPLFGYMEKGFDQIFSLNKQKKINSQRNLNGPIYITQPMSRKEPYIITQIEIDISTQTVFFSQESIQLNLNTFLELFKGKYTEKLQELIENFEQIENQKVILYLNTTKDNTYKNQWFLQWYIGQQQYEIKDSTSVFSVNFLKNTVKKSDCGLEKIYDLKIHKERLVESQQFEYEDFQTKFGDQESNLQLTEQQVEKLIEFKSQHTSQFEKGLLSYFNPELEKKQFGLKKEKKEKAIDQNSKKNSKKQIGIEGYTEISLQQFEKLLKKLSTQLNNQEKEENIYQIQIQQFTETQKQELVNLCKKKNIHMNISQIELEQNSSEIKICFHSKSKIEVQNQIEEIFKYQINVKQDIEFPEYWQKQQINKAWLFEIHKDQQEFIDINNKIQTSLELVKTYQSNLKKMLESNRLKILQKKLFNEEYDQEKLNEDKIQIEKNIDQVTQNLSLQVHTKHIFRIQNIEKYIEFSNQTKNKIYKKEFMTHTKILEKQNLSNYLQQFIYNQNISNNSNNNMDIQGIQEFTSQVGNDIVQQYQNKELKEMFLIYCLFEPIEQFQGVNYQQHKQTYESQVYYPYYLIKIQLKQEKE